MSLANDQNWAGIMRLKMPTQRKNATPTCEPPSTSR